MPLEWKKLKMNQSVQKFLDAEFFDDEHAREIIQGTSSHEHVRLGKEDASRADVVRFLEATASMH